MKKCLNFFPSFCPLKKILSPKPLPRETREEILEKELDAFIELELFNINNKFINKHGITNIKCKLIQQYYWSKNKIITDKDKYITLSEWHNRFSFQ